MAIGFVVLVGSIAAGLSGLVTSSNTNRITLGQVRDLQYAADGAIEEAITEVRFLDRDTDGACGAPVGTTTSTLNGYDVRVVWQAVCGVVRTATGDLVAQRNVLFTACEDEGPTCAGTDVLVRAQVNFEQAATGEVSRTWVQAWSYDGRDEPPTTVVPSSDPSWTWEVYDGTALGGAVMAATTTPAIDVNWGSGSPDPSVGNDTFSVRVTRTLVLPAGSYTVIGGSDDGIRVSIDGVRVIDRWSDRSYGTNSVPVTLTAGAHTVVVEFYENGGQARLTLQILDTGGTDVSR